MASTDFKFNPNPGSVLLPSPVTPSENLYGDISNLSPALEDSLHQTVDTRTQVAQSLKTLGNKDKSQGRG